MLKGMRGKERAKLLNAPLAGGVESLLHLAVRSGSHPMVETMLRWVSAWMCAGQGQQKGGQAGG